MKGLLVKTKRSFILFLLHLNSKQFLCVNWCLTSIDSFLTLGTSVVFFSLLFDWDAGLWQCNIDPGEVLCPAVLVKTTVCRGCSVLRAHKTSLRSILFCICRDAAGLAAFWSPQPVVSFGVRDKSSRVALGKKMGRPWDDAASAKARSYERRRMKRLWHPGYPFFDELSLYCLYTYLVL